MPMTLAQWNEWPVETREFYAKLFTCYSITDDGVLCIDAKRRQLCVQEQLKKKDQKIIARATLVSYVLTSGIEKENGPLNVNTKCNISCLLFSVEKLGANKYKLVGSFRLPTQDIPEHFETVVKQKIGLEDKMARSMKDQAFFVPLGEIDDLTVLSSCALVPDEIEFLLHDPLFMTAIENEAQNLSKIDPIKSPVDIKAKIIEHLCSASVQEVQQASLLNLNASNVSTYWVLYNHAQFKSICKYLEGVKSQLIRISLEQGLCFGPSRFLFLSEYINLLKIALWSYGLDGKFPHQVNDIVKEPIVYSVLNSSEICKLFQRVATEQLKLIKETKFPFPHYFMGKIWDVHCSPDDLLNMLRHFHYADLFTMAEIAGFRREEASSVFGLASTKLLDEVETELNSGWEDNKESLLESIQKLKTETVATSQAGLGVQGLFGHSSVKKEISESQDLSGIGLKSSL